MTMSKHVRVEIDGQVVVDEQVDDVKFKNMVISQGHSRGYRVHRPTREYVLTYKRTEHDDHDRRG